MSSHPLRLAISGLLASTLLAVSARAEGPGPIRGILIGAGRATPETLAAWKAKGINAVVVPLDESIPRATWADLAAGVERAGLALYPWIEVARNPALADAHPDWMAALGVHEDWRRRFPAAPAKAPGRVIKAWPWVPIGSVPAFEAHRRRLVTLLEGLPGAWAGAFLNDLQAGPSSCGCGNDQCRWALDYNVPATAPKAPGDDAAARLVADLRGHCPGKAIVPAWVTECEFPDLPGAAKGTGYCGGVPCARSDCWPRYSRMLAPLLAADSGPLAVPLWESAFGRDPAWVETALTLAEQPPRNGTAIPPGRIVAVLQGWDKPEAGRDALIGRARRAGGGYVLALEKVEQGWEPRSVEVPR